MQIPAIINKYDLSDPAHYKLVAKEMQSVSNYELQLYCNMKESSEPVVSFNLRPVAMAVAEKERRIRKEDRSLKIFTTILSGFIGLAGVALGATLTLVASWLAG
ncbi:hypothetical protein [uncultured Hoeflea sp.]|uniref:hypothetical protein n=1 Tax=uncultured Hoeflea sp. TaxID=538666 RepID=UPI0030D99FC5|tara:strand:- start:1483 stop:1794 length:312 start_codon:yes stop_codon:yes gene_type:complete